MGARAKGVAQTMMGRVMRMGWKAMMLRKAFLVPVAMQAKPWSATMLYSTIVLTNTTNPDNPSQPLNPHPLQLAGGGLDNELYNFNPRSQEELNKFTAGMSMGMDLPISPPRFAVFGGQGSPGMGSLGSSMLPPTAPGSSGKNKRGLSVVIPSSGSKEQGSKVNKMSPPPSFGMGDGGAGAFLQSPGGQAFPSPTAFLSELQTPTNGDGSLDGMTPGALAQFSWNSPKPESSLEQAEAADSKEGDEGPAKRQKTE